MVLGYHVAFGAYGSWLPNDPRGSWSTWVRSLRLHRHGQSIGPDPFWRPGSPPQCVTARLATKRSLICAPVRFTDRQILAIGRGFARIIDKCGYAVWACAILRDHVHMVIGRHYYKVERMVGLLKQGVTTELTETGLHPMNGYGKFQGSLPSPWQRSCWRSYLNTHGDIELAIEYVQENPEKAGLPRQRWPFVVPVEL